MENEDLLYRETEEILTKVAVLLEISSYETSLLAIQKPEETYLLMACNRTDNSVMTFQEKVLELIKKEKLKAEDWKFFNGACKRYVHSNTKQSICDRVWASIFSKIVAAFKADMFHAKPSEFYSSLILVIEKIPDLMTEYFKDCLIKGIKPQNISTMVHFLQHQISNLQTVRYYYHWDKFKRENEVAEFIFRKVHLIDNMRFVGPPDRIPRHAEMTLIDAVVNDGSIKALELSNSKKVCLDCHAFLLLFNEASLVPINICGGAHDLTFDNWKKPHHMNSISQAYQMDQGTKFDSDFDLLKQVIDDNIPINRKAVEMISKHRSMFHLPLVIQKALKIRENIPF